MTLIRRFFCALLALVLLMPAAGSEGAQTAYLSLDEQIAEHLKALEAAGVEIQVCGTCLNFYGLTDQLKAGTVSNMYDIVSRMQRAAKVLSL